MKRKKVESFYPSSIKAYSFAFKQKVAREVESGLISKDGARRKYGIGGKTTVLNLAAGKDDVLNIQEIERMLVIEIQ